MAISKSRRMFLQGTLGLTATAAAIPSPSEEARWFRLARRGATRHCLITPQRETFLALGVNHIGMLSQGRKNATTDWPAEAPGVVAQLRSWGCNTAGYGAPDEVQRLLPYFNAITLAPIEKHRSIPTPNQPGSFAFPDVFDPEWARDLDQRIAAACAPCHNDPLLIGWFWTDTPTWDLQLCRALRGTDWVSAIRRLPPGAPGRRQYAAFLAERYPSRIAVCNELYGLSLRDFTDAATADLSRIAIGRHVVREDDEAFLSRIATRYYEAAGKSQRRHDSNHLVFGERYLAGDAPDSVIAAAAPHIDAFSVQPGDQYVRFVPPSTEYPQLFLDRLHHQSGGKPVLICDHAISFPTPEHPRTIFEQAPDEVSAAHQTGQFLDQAARTPYVLGYLRCQYIDRPAGFGRGLRQGLLDSAGKPRVRLTAAYQRGFQAWLNRFSREAR